MNADEALERLLEGNKRFVFGKSEASPERPIIERWKLGKAQHPFAVILTCSDSRLAPEILFDEWLGDLFVIRTAGHVVDSAVLGSIAYAIEHLHCELVMVLGHENCGAVSAAVEGGEHSEPIEALISAIEPMGTVERTVKHHARVTAEKLAQQFPETKFVPARYDLDTGKVR